MTESPWPPPSVLIDTAAIQNRVAQLAGTIARDYPHGIHVVTVLKGAFMFAADLIRYLDDVAVSLDFLSVSSYGSGTTTSGEVRLLKDLETPLDGRDVLLVEDIVDTGLTLAYLQGVLRRRAPRVLRTAALLSKPSRRQIDVPVEYVGFEIEDRFVVGYGMDRGEHYRHLPHIAFFEQGA